MQKHLSRFFFNSQKPRNINGCGVTENMCLNKFECEKVEVTKPTPVDGTSFNEDDDGDELKNEW